MTKPMYCPMSFASLLPYASTDYANVCTPDCAWAVNDKEEYWCGMMDDQAWNTNTRPLKDEDDV